MTRPGLPTRRLLRRAHGCARATGQDGFILLESIVAISLITIILAALGSFALRSVTATSELRARQGAAQVATSAMTLVDSIRADDLVTGRDQTSVEAQFTNANAIVQPYLAAMTHPSDDLATTPGQGRNATISTSPTTQTLNNVAYEVNTYVGTCVIPNGTSSCVASGGAGVSYRRVVVGVTWKNNGCSSASCTFVTSTLVNFDPDPVFNTNKSTPPATPIVVNPGNLTSTVGGPVSLQLAVKSGTGVNPMTWATTAGTLPTGLTLGTSGVVSGTPTTAQAATSVTVTVTDAFGRTGSASFTWAVVTAPTVTTPAPQSTRVNTATSLNVASTCPNSPCTFVLSNPPPGLAINPSTGVISGTPTTVGTYATVTVSIVDAVGVYTSTAPFTWAITKLGPTVTSPGAQGVTVGTTANIAIPYTCPYPSCTITLSNAIPGLVLTNPAATSSNATPEDASKFTAPGPVDTTGTTNLSTGKTATQSTTGFSGAPSRAIDGNTDGVYNNGSVSHTDYEAQPWWQVDLGAASLVRAVRIWNRTDCCDTRLVNFYVFASQSDMSGKTSAQLLADPTVTVQRVSGLNGQPNITIPAQSAARYVRVQLANFTGANYLSLAEVQVLGTVDTGTSVTVTNTSGTVYATGVVAASAVPSGTSKAYTPGLSIVDVGGASSATAAGTWTAYARPTVAALGTRTMGTRTSPNVPVDYTCPNAPCTLTLASQPTGLGLSTTSGATGTNGTTSLTLNSTSGTVYVNGLIDVSAVPSGASKVYAPVVTITDAAAAAATGTGSWTVTRGPTLTNPGTQAVEPNQPASLQLAYSCPNNPCSTWSADSTIVGGDGTVYPVTVSSTGVLSYPNAPPGGTFTVRVTVTDRLSQTDTISFTLKVQTFTLSIGNQTIARPLLNATTTKTLDVSGIVQPQADSYIYSLSSNAPSWLTIDSATGIITATATRTSNSATGITVTVTSRLGSSSTVTSNLFNWTVTG